MPIPDDVVGLKKERSCAAPEVAIHPTMSLVVLGCVGGSGAVASGDGLYVQWLTLLLSALFAGSLNHAVNPLGTPSVNSTMAFSRVGSLSIALAFFNSW